jgi:glycosyltransferase involved in cell wall biosynthesis
VKDATAWYHHVDVFISNAYSEGLQVSPLEAMASGCYCLSHHWAGADELLPVDHLYFTDLELQQKLLHYCNLPESGKQEELTKLQSLVQQNFNVHHTKTQIRRIIEEVGQ